MVCLVVTMGCVPKEEWTGLAGCRDVEESGKARVGKRRRDRKAWGSWHRVSLWKKCSAQGWEDRQGSRRKE